MAALACLAQVLGQGRNSILYQNLVKNQLALQANAFSNLSELSGELIFQIVPLPGKTLADMENLYRTSLDSFEKRGVTDEDIEKFKGGMESQLINGLQSVSGKVSQLAAFQTFTGNPNKIADLLKMYTSLTRQDVMAAYNKYIKNKGAVILSVTPKGQEQNIAKEDNYKIDTTNYTAPDYGYAGLKYVKATDNFDRKKMPGNGANPVVKVPAFWKKTLPNGAKLIGAANTELPLVTLSLTIPGGHLAQANNLSKVGLASFFADMMAEDTKNYTAEQMSVELQKLGSTISVNSGTDGVTYTVQSLKKNLGKTLALLEERLLNPKFTKDAFERNQKQTLESFKVQKSQPAYVANVVFSKMNFGANNILGMAPEGTEETIRNMTLEDVQNYYNNYMTSNGAKVVVVGDIKQEEILPKLAFLNKLPNKKIVLPKPGATPAVDKTKVYLVDVPKAAQSEFRIGYATGLKYDATGDYYKANLSNYALGSSPNGRLFLDLREDKGWTYGASSSFSGDKYAGDYEFSSGIRANVTDSALAETMKVINTYLKEGPTKQEVIFMKSAIGQRDALRYETGAQKALFIGRILDYDLPANYVDIQNKILQGITPEQIKTTANKYIKPEKMNILLVGDKAAILDGVKKLGYEIVELDADGNKLEKKTF
jgi:zinc protease